MKSNVLKAIFGSKNDRELRRMFKVVRKINALEDSFQQLTDEQLSEKTDEFKQRLQEGTNLDALLPEAFALVREAGSRVMQMRHFDCQLIGAMTLHEGRIAEMRTGEGKTYVATLAVYLNALAGKGVHVVTVNDYLASRDADWMRPLYEFLGLSVGVIVSGQETVAKREAYRADITYGTNNEFGFDYLRDNMAFSKEDKVQRAHPFAVIDEVDSILIDEARTPLIISGAAEDSSLIYKKVNQIIPKLERGEEIESHLPKMLAMAEEQQQESGHFAIDEKSRQVNLTDLGHQFVEELLTKEGLLEEGASLYAASNLMLLQHVHAGLKAHHLFQKNVDYIVQGGQVVIVDEHTGRTMPGRRWSEGIHQAIEAKERLSIKAENQTLASTTFQNYFRLYSKLSGMTGTADTEAFEFKQIYGLDVVVIPTNKPMQRKDLNDVVYSTQREKYQAIVEDIQTAQKNGAPVLVGTASVESSELISNLLKQEKVTHKVLNAKYHEKEAEIIAQAGRPGVVTIATNMAGRGTDIVLGGNWQAEVAQLENPSEAEVEKIKSDWQQRLEQVLEAGGLHIIGTERHESRRIDNQLRGRAGRQGDPGVSRFFLSFEDGLLRIFLPERVSNMFRNSAPEGEAIELGLITKSIESAQKKVEARNFDVRKTLLEYDDVNNEQRKSVYGLRDYILEAESVSDQVKTLRQDVIEALVGGHIPPQSMIEQWDIAGLESALKNDFAIELPISDWLKQDQRLHEPALKTRITEHITEQYEKKMALLEPVEIRHQLEKQVMLQALDRLWKEHLASMDYLRQGIHLRGYAAKNPKQEYKREAFEMFEGLLDAIKYETIRVLTASQIRQPEEVEQIEQQRREAQQRQAMEYRHQAAAGDGLQRSGPDEAEEPKAAPFQRETKKVGRNEPCPCGSGKKYKHCHGKLD